MIPLQCPSVDAGTIGPVKILLPLFNVSDIFIFVVLRRSQIGGARIEIMSVYREGNLFVLIMQVRRERNEGKSAELADRSVVPKLVT